MSDSGNDADRPSGTEDSDAEPVVYRWRAGTLQVHDATNTGLVGNTARIYGASVGLRSSEPRDVIEELRQGLPYAGFQQLQQQLEVSSRELAAVVGITTRTLARRRKEGRLQVDESDRLLRVGVLFDRAVEVLGREAEARAWLKAPRSALDDRSPLDSADTEPGARAVEDLLGRIQHGVFT